MSEPKFQVGQQVAVLTSDFKVCIPATRITGLRLDEEAIATNPVTGKRGIAPAGWYYCVDAFAERHRIHERALRPIQPDEYSEPLITSREVSA